MQYACKEPVSLTQLLRIRNRPAIGLQWLLRREGPAASNHLESGGFVRGNDQVPYPNLMFHFLPLAVDRDAAGPPAATATRCTSARCSPTPAAR